MDIFAATEPSELGNFQAIVEAFPGIWVGKVLDVGCRSGNFRRALSSHPVDYFGLDIYAPADVLGDLGAGLPFGDRSFDTVVALDVLEHTDDIYNAVGELCRTSGKHVVIALPNIYDVLGRLKFLLGQPLSGKYGLPSEPPDDRHRWVVSYKEAENFCDHWAEKTGFRIAAKGSLIGPKRAHAPGRLMIKAFPNLFSPRFLALLSRNAS